MCLQQDKRPVGSVGILNKTSAKNKQTIKNVIYASQIINVHFQTAVREISSEAISQPALNLPRH